MTDAGSKHARLPCHVLYPEFTTHPSSPPQYPSTPSRRLPNRISTHTPQPDAKELTQRAPRRNRPHRPLPVPELRRDRQRPLIANAHIQQPLVPPLDDLPFPNRKGQRLAPVVAGVELGAVSGKGAAVVDLDAVAALGLAVAFVLDGVFGCDLCAEGEGEEEGEEREDGEAHCCGCAGGQLRWWRFGGDVWILRES